MKKKWIGIGGLVLLVLVVFLIKSAGNGVEALRIEKKDYEEKILAVGRLHLEQEISLVAEVRGKVVFLGAREGDTLSAGAILLKMEDEEKGYLLKDKESEYADLQAQYKQIMEYQLPSAKETFKSLTTEKEKAEKEYEDAKQLHQEGAISESQLLEKETKRASLLSQWNVQKLKVEALSPGGTESSALYARLQGAKAAYENALATAQKYMIRVPWEALVLKIHVDAEDFVPMGEVLAEIGKKGNFLVEVELDEKYFPYVSVGQEGRVFLNPEDRKKDSLGSISEISPRIDENKGTFAMVITLPSDFSYQASRLTVNVEIPMKKMEKAIRIPQAYLVDENSVYLYEGGEARKKKIRIERGLSSSVYVLEGLKEGNVILLPGEGVEEGKRVKIEGEGNL